MTSVFPFNLCLQVAKDDGELRTRGFQIKGREHYAHVRAYFSKMVGLITHTITMLETMRVADIMVTRKILPLLAGNFPRMIQYYSRSSKLFCTGIRKIQAQNPNWWWKWLSERHFGCHSIFRTYLTFKIPPSSNDENQYCYSQKGRSQWFSQLPQFSGTRGLWLHAFPIG